MPNHSPFPTGSLWRKWDLHVHTPDTLKADSFVGADSDEKWDNFCKTINESKEDVSVIGVTDYLLIDNYKKFLTLAETGKITKRFDFIIPNIELRLVPVTGAGSALNLHLLIDPAFVPQLEERLYSKLTMKSGDTIYNASKDGLTRLGKTVNGNLADDAAWKEGARKFVIDSDALKTVFDNDPSLIEHCIVVVSNNSNDGASGVIQHSTFFTGNSSDLDIKRQAIYKFSRAIFSGNPNDGKYFLGNSMDSKDEVVRKCGSLKPCIHGSDAHTNEKVFHPDQNRFCWIKADPNFEGLKQIIYEPEERVKVGPVQPDQKDDYRVIKKIKFESAIDFPAEIEFNGNLCSIIGSRSSGKSALLAYLAHAVDPEMAQKMIDGPGEGEEYHWGKISLKHSIEWANGKSNDESKGKVVYIRQNYLFEESKNPDEIKAKIEPVLFKTIPVFEAQYLQFENSLDGCNQQISGQIDAWFALADSGKILGESLKNLGDKKIVEESKKGIESSIQVLKDKNKLSDDDLKQYKKISSDAATLQSRIKDIDSELTMLSTSGETSYFSTVKTTLSPSLLTLPKKLQEIIDKKSRVFEVEILESANLDIAEYKSTILTEKKEALTEIEKIKTENKELIEKYKSNLELEGLLKRLNEHLEIIKRIELVEVEIKTTEAQSAVCVQTVKDSIATRKNLIDDLVTKLRGADQSGLQGIIFDIEYGFGENLENATQKINMRDKTDFVGDGQIKIEVVREKPGEFLMAVHSKKQKIIAHNDSKEVAKEILVLTEKVLFSAKMEGDKIGGFTEPTMTPGKRALFALRLILAESDDKWPLLIDQPEDDLDSRSIYDEVVPFLKEKKRERQIIMVSHNANLVIGADSEQIVVANRNGNDRKNEDGKQFNYLTGSLEFTSKKNHACQDTLMSQGVCEHACEILDGGRQAFESRKHKYNIK